MTNTSYELPLSLEVKANLSDEEIVQVAIQGYRKIVGNSVDIPDHGYLAGRIVEETGVSFGAAILVAASEPRE